MTRILTLYYSMYGHTEIMAKEIAKGAASVADANITVKRVPELMLHDVAAAAGAKLEQDAPIASPDELPLYDAIIFGTPTRYGNMAAQMRNFLDQTGQLWAEGLLVGKVASVFTSSGLQHFGQETTITSFHVTLLHLGMIIVGVPTIKEMMNMDEISGGGPYGAGTIVGPDGKRLPSKNELAIARYQGRYVAGVAKRLAAVSTEDRRAGSK